MIFNMSKTKKKTGKTSTGDEAKTDTKNKPKPAEHLEIEEQEGFDFGGLPQRDLKKSLGCG